MNTTQSNREKLFQLVRIYIFLKLLLGESIEINELVLQKIQYINAGKDNFKVMSLCLEEKSHKHTYKVHNNSIVFFDEMENAKVFDINLFIGVYKEVESILQNSKNYEQLLTEGVIRKFNNLVKISTFDEIKLVFVKDEKVYNRKFKIVLNQSVVENTIACYEQKIFFLLQEKIDFNINGIYSNKIKDKKLKDASISMTGDIASLIALFYIKYGVKTLDDFYKKVCEINPTALHSSKVKKHYKKEIEVLLLEYIKNNKAYNYICLKPPYLPVGYLLDNDSYANLKKYKINLTHERLKNSILSSCVEIYYCALDKNYDFIQECITTKKQLEILLVKGQFYEDSLKYKTINW